MKVRKQIESSCLLLTRLSLPKREADVIGCNVYGDGRVAAIDTWNPLSPRWNVLDDDQVLTLKLQLFTMKCNLIFHMQSDICHYDAEIKDRGRLRCRYVVRYFRLDETQSSDSILYTLTDLVAVLEAHRVSKIWTSITITISCLGEDKIVKVRMPCMKFNLQWPNTLTLIN